MTACSCKHFTTDRFSLLLLCLLLQKFKNPEDFRSVFSNCVPVGRIEAMLDTLRSACTDWEELARTPSACTLCPKEAP
jgi:hypothetical protein